jgi:hypothetical protein
VRALVHAALGPDAEPTTAATVRALVDHEVHRVLADAGFGASEAAERIRRVLDSGFWARPIAFAGGGASPKGTFRT